MLEPSPDISANRPRERRVHLINVSGGIACGKSTTIGRVEKVLDAYCSMEHPQKVPIHEWRLMKEPVHEWREYLERFYTKRDSDSLFALQNKVLEYHAEQVEMLREMDERNLRESMNGAPSVLCVERCPWDVMRVFLPMNEKLLTREQLDHLRSNLVSLWDVMRELSAGVLSIHLTCSSFTQQVNRLRARDKVGGDEAIDTTYLEQLQHKYQGSFNEDSIRGDCAGVRFEEIDTCQMGQDDVCLECMFLILLELGAVDRSSLHSSAEHVQLLKNLVNSNSWSALNGTTMPPTMPREKSV